MTEQSARDATTIAHEVIAAEHTHGIHAAAEIVQRAIDTAKAQQREADAKVADDIGEAYGEDETGWLECSENIAAAIREGTET